MIRLALTAAFLLISVHANAGPRLVCNLSESATVIIVPQADTVAYRFFVKGEKTLTLEYFSHANCPHCYAFKGMLDGKAFEGVTRSKGNPSSGQFLITLTLKLDGVEQPPIQCIRAD